MEGQDQVVLHCSNPQTWQKKERVALVAVMVGVMAGMVALVAVCIGEGNGNPLQCSCLENPRVGGAWWAAVSGAHRVGHD